MNQRTVKLLRRFAIESGESFKTLKVQWHKTPRSRRAEVRAAMVAGLWAGKLRAWQKRCDLIQKEAADKLGVKFESYRDWCDGDGEPSKFARIEIERRMKAIEDSLNHISANG